MVWLWKPLFSGNLRRRREEREEKSMFCFCSPEVQLSRCSVHQQDEGMDTWCVVCLLRSAELIGVCPFKSYSGHIQPIKGGVKSSIDLMLLCTHGCNVDWSLKSMFSQLIPTQPEEHGCPLCSEIQTEVKWDDAPPQIWSCSYLLGWT